MKKSFRTIFLIVFVLLFQFCKVNDPWPDPTPEAYGTPFDGIPEVENMILYEVNTRAFGPTHDFEAVIQQLDSIALLGVNVLWLMPIHPIGEVQSVNSPYSVKDYEAINPEFGDIFQLRQLSDSAHARGMAVILDWVANHTAWDHEWIEAHPDWYTQDSDGNIIHPAGTNWMDVADLNYMSYDMRAEMIRSMEYWIYEANIDGFRCDYADGVPFSFWLDAWTALREIPGRKLIFLAEGKRKDHFTAGFDLCFSWDFYGITKQVFSGSPATQILPVHHEEYQNTPTGKHWLRFTTNHDESAWDATPIELFNGDKGALAASVISIFTGGVPLIYGSQEVGTAQTIPFFSQSSIDWSNNPELLNSYRSILSFYRTSNTAKSPNITEFSTEDLFCILKEESENDLLIMVNVRNSQQDFILPNELHGSNWIDGQSQESFSLSSEISLQPYEYLLLVR